MDGDDDFDVDVDLFEDDEPHNGEINETQN